MTAAACQLLSSAKDALHDDDVSRLQIPSLEKLGNRMSPDVEPEPDVSTEPVLKPEDTTSDVVKPNDDQNEETSLEDIEAKVNRVLHCVQKKTPTFILQRIATNQRRLVTLS